MDNQREIKSKHTCTRATCNRIFNDTYRGSQANQQSLNGGGGFNMHGSVFGGSQTRSVIIPPLMP